MARHSSDEFANPLIERYASSEMSFVFSPDFKFGTWRELWISLAESQRELGLNISKEQIAEMKQHASNIDYERVRSIEEKTRHDVMAHVGAFGELCPKAKPIIHLGATSAFVGDNTDLIQMRKAARILLQRLTPLLKALSDFAIEHRSRPTLGFTHFQPAQCTTVGKRACLWLQDLCMDFEALESFIASLPFRGVKGTTGTQAGYLKLFDADHEKVKKLDSLVAEKMGFCRVFPVTGQTYTRKVDANVGAILSGLAQSMHKLANDIRLLQHLREIEEPFGKSQVGSSAMAYKRNPMRSERIAALSRYIISLCTSPMMTAAEQWFERTLDDSANKRLSIPEMFLAADACLVIALDVCSGLQVYPKIIERRIREELPFMATENILMEAVKLGGDRQELHERIRTHAMAAVKGIKEEGLDNDILERIASDKAFRLSRAAIEELLDVTGFVGRAPEQTSEFVASHVEPIIERGDKLGSIRQAELTV